MSRTFVLLPRALGGGFLIVGEGVPCGRVMAVTWPGGAGPVTSAFLRWAAGIGISGQAVQMQAMAEVPATPGGSLRSS